MNGCGFWCWFIRPFAEMLGSLLLLAALAGACGIGVLLYAVAQWVKERLAAKRAQNKESR